MIGWAAIVATVVGIAAKIAGVVSWPWVAVLAPIPAVLTVGLVAYWFSRWVREQQP